MLLSACGSVRPQERAQATLPNDHEGSNKSLVYSSAFEDDLRDGVLFGVGKGERHVNCAELRRELGSLAVKCDRGTASGLTTDFSVAPGDPVIPSRADGLHRGFFGGEARSVTLDAVGLRLAVADLGLGKDSMEEAVTKTCNGSFDAWYLRYVDAGADDHVDSLVDGRLMEKRYSFFVYGLRKLVASASCQGTASDFDVFPQAV